jgi:hypothetical protein
MQKILKDRIVEAGIGLPAGGMTSARGSTATRPLHHLIVSLCAKK